MIQHDGKLLILQVPEAAMWGMAPLHEAIIRKLRQWGVSGAVAQSGLFGYGPETSLAYNSPSLGHGNHRPVTITVMDEAGKLIDLIPALRAMAPEATIMLLDGQLILAPQKSASAPAAVVAEENFAERGK